MNSTEEPDTSTLLIEKHINFIQSLDKKEDSLSYHLTEHLRLNGIYWALVSIQLLKKPNTLSKDEMIQWVLKCWDPIEGGFSPHPFHDPHLHSTLSAIQILVMQNSLDKVDKQKITNYILARFNDQTGSFSGDQWNETDTRFSYCAISGLSLLGTLQQLNQSRATDYLINCQNFDGGFGMIQGSESHAAYVWTSVAALAILGNLDLIDQNKLGWWLSERQLENGGLNGRPEKLEDVCYSWWALASLEIIGKTHWIDGNKLKSFILSCQDSNLGGIADRPNDMPDLWHTIFGLSGLSILNFHGLEKIDPIYCIPTEFTKSLNHQS
ncbi:uncharacterized protein MELLADRAFT_73002 [Melampsora larici-populina 98AG31]|uniref:Geranylgeranyl transferase type-2 subunit beta n=1 Tax=Melampsora larici-populina (strain 98AG31 / pathotype 3-4-7) TaxID=747676 RepID=F4S1U9_MELLP|nr:uncharacterized protein MELLADRAFT_73002 [Melampsora larici-populina 98AG31]EGG01441.1 hypothetical protein MELLADRAFT_73002 [Melampsora larici-populina 98AG31]